MNGVGLINSGSRSAKRKHDVERYWCARGCPPRFRSSTAWPRRRPSRSSSGAGHLEADGGHSSIGLSSASGVLRRDRGAHAGRAAGEEVPPAGAARGIRARPRVLRVVRRAPAHGAADDGAPLRENLPGATSRFAPSTRWFNDPTKVEHARSRTRVGRSRCRTGRGAVPWRGSLDDIPAVCQRAFEAVGGRDWGQVDLRLDRGGCRASSTSRPTYPGPLGAVREGRRGAGLVVRGLRGPHREGRAQTGTCAWLTCSTASWT